MIGKTILHYKILEKLGEGGMGVVYKAEDTRLKRIVALKMLSQETAGEAEVRDRLIVEAQAAAALNHQNITTVFAIEEFDDDIFIVMEYVDGKELREEVASGKWQMAKIIEVALKIARGLREAHNKGIIHRDIKSANIMVAKTSQVKIMDFGLSKFFENAEPEKLGATLGTIAYMSPEQVRGEAVDNRSDIWSFGAVIYEMLTGEVPFPGEYAQAMLYAILNEEPESISEFREDVPDALIRTVERALQKNIESRYQKIEDIIADLKSIGDAGNVVGISDGGVVGVKHPLQIDKYTRQDIARNASPLQVFDIPSVAVLPFADMSQEKDQEYFCDGMAEELIDSLSKVESWRVASRTSAFRFKGVTEDVREIGQQLNVSHVLEGSVRKAGNRLRITAQLTNVNDGFQIYSEKYDRELVDVFAIQDDLARAIVQKLKVELGEKEKVSLTKRYTEDSDAYQLYLKGRYFINKGTSKDTQKSIEYFERALKKDKNYALAHTGLADAYTLLGGTFSAPMLPSESMPKAKAAAKKAMEIDDSLAEAHTSLALVRFWYDWNWDGAEMEFKRAIELKSAYPRAYQWYAEFLSAMQRHQEAIETIRKALDLDPLSAHINWHVGKIYFLARNYDLAISQCQKSLEMNPKFMPALGLLRRIYQSQGDAEKTIAEIDRLWGRSLLEIVALKRAYEKSGWQAIWQKQLDWAKEEEMPPLRYAELYTQIEDFDRAIEWLEKAYEQRSSSLVYLNVFASFDPLRSDERFKALLRKIGLAEG